MVTQITTRLHAYRLAFEQGILPRRDRSFYWTKRPCVYCDFKPVCRKDDKEDVEHLSDSAAIDFAKQVRPTYDLRKVISDVKGEWSGLDSD
jgi:hypothetical protein